MKSRLLRYEEFDKMSSQAEKKFELQKLKAEYTRIERDINLAGYDNVEFRKLYDKWRYENE